MASLKGESNPAYKHGHASKGNYKGLYLRHRNIILRCYSPSCKDYIRYGAKGITVCDRWRKGEDGKSGYECFLSDMGYPPFDGASIDRIDTSKGYSPDNCRWATIDQQANNKVSNRFIEIDSLGVDRAYRIARVPQKNKEDVEKISLSCDIDELLKMFE